MPSVRSVILLAVLLLVVSVVAAFAALFRTPDSDGMGQDSYGTRGFGFRAIHDVLSELEIPTRRSFSPPDPGDTTQTIVLLQPDATIAGTEPAYLHRLRAWVERGGRLVITLPRGDRSALAMMTTDDDTKLPSIQESLGLSEVATELQLSPAAAKTRRRLATDDVSLTDELMNAFGTLSPPQSVNTDNAGSLAEIGTNKLSLSRDEVQTLEVGDSKPIGSISYQPEDEPKTLVAEFEAGAGRIVIVGDVALFQNRHLGREDNGVLAARLLSPDGRTVVFDEFYHGLGVRGNPLYLLTRPGYAALVLGLIVVASLVVWRQAIFLGPSLSDPPVQRRDLAEYLTAMGRFFSLGRETRPFLIEQMRDGVLRELCRTLSLATETHDVDVIAGMISRRHPERADRLRRTIAEIDSELSSRSWWSESETIDAMQRLTDCLSTPT